MLEVPLGWRLKRRSINRGIVVEEYELTSLEEMVVKRTCVEASDTTTPQRDIEVYLEKIWKATYQE